MSDDIVARLRHEIQFWRSHEEDTLLMREAADEIERLRSELAAANKRAVNRLAVEVERDALRKLLKEARRLMTYVMTFNERAQMCVRIDAALNKGREDE